MNIKEAIATKAIFGDISDIILAACYDKNGKPLIKHIKLLKDNADKKAEKYPRYFKK